MPNHCCNTLVMSAATLPEITGRYVRKNEQGERIFDFERIIPVGDVLDWHEQRLAKWGTKWVGYDVSIGEATLDFFTAWSPPIPVIKKLAELHKDFVFRLEYYEPGNAFRGKATARWSKGAVALEDKSWNMTSEDFEELGLAQPI